MSTSGPPSRGSMNAFGGGGGGAGGIGVGSFGKRVFATDNRRLADMWNGEGEGEGDADETTGLSSTSQGMTQSGSSSLCPSAGNPTPEKESEYNAHSRAGSMAEPASQNSTSSTLVSMGIGSAKLSSSTPTGSTPIWKSVVAIVSNSIHSATNIVSSRRDTHGQTGAVRQPGSEGSRGNSSGADPYGLSRDPSTLESAPLTDPGSSQPPIQLPVENDHELISYKASMKLLLPLAIPSMVAVALGFALSAMTFAFLGKWIGTDAMSSASVGFYFMCIAALYPLTGVAFAVDTLCTQAYGRDPNSTVQGAVAQRSLVVSTVLMIPMSWLLQHCDVLLTKWYPSEVGKAAAEWVALTPLYILPTLYCTTLAKFLCSQYLPHLPTIALTVAVLSTPISQGFFIQTYGFSGSAIGLGATAWLQFVTLALLTYFNADARRRFGSWSWKNITAWSQYSHFLRLGLPSVAFVCAESGAFDVSALLSARLDTTASAAWTVILSMFLIAECVCGGMSIATCACVGSALGSGKPKRAKRLAISAILLVAVWATVDALLLYWFHESIFNFFTQDPNVHAALAEIVWIILPLHISDSIQFVFQGIFSGCGQNHLGAIALVLSLWVMGIGGILYFLHFTKLGLIGVPLGLTIGLASACPVLCFLVFKRFDWTALAKEAMKEHMEDEEMSDLFPMTPASPVPGQQSPASFVGTMVQFSP